MPRPKSHWWADPSVGGSLKITDSEHARWTPPAGQKAVPAGRQRHVEVQNPVGGGLPTDLKET